MKKSILATGLAVLLSVGMLAPAVADQGEAERYKGHKHRGEHHGFGDTEKYIKRFEDPVRAEWQKPDLVVDMLELKPGMNVADIGAATGYFTRRMARKIMPGGYAMAVDLEEGFFPYLLTRAHEEDVFNVFPVKGLPDDPLLPDRSLDVILIVDTLHHISERDEYYKKLKASLREGGRVVVVDFKKDEEIPVGPGPEMRLRAVDVQKEFEAAGFSVEIDAETLPYQYILTATTGE